MEPTNTSRPIIKYLLIAAVIILPILAFVIGFNYRSNDLQNTPHNSQITSTPTPVVQNDSWQIEESNVIAYPILDKNQNLVLYDVQNKKVIDTNIILNSGSGGALGLGESDPIGSYDYRYTFYISDDKTLEILNNETLESTSVPNSQGVTYISGVSPDGNSVLYYVQELNIQDPTFGMFREKQFTFNKNVVPGFHLFNIQTGSSTWLYPLTSFSGFIDSSRILAQYNYGDSVVQYAVFNINDFSVDYTLLPEVYGGIQLGNFSFTSSGDYFTYLYSSNRENSTDDSNVAYAKFPNVPGELIAKGDWADFQFPSISPDGKYMVYARRTDWNGGSPIHEIVSYNTSTGESKAIMPGTHARFVTPTVVISDRIDPNSGTPVVTQYHIYDYSTGRSELIYSEN